VVVTPAFLPEPDHGTKLVESYRRLAEIFHLVLSEQSRESLLGRVADTLADLVPYDSLIIYEADEGRRELVPVVARDQYADEILQTRCYFGEGISGWAVENRRPVLANQAHLDPRVKVIPGTPPDEPEALVSIPLVARGRLKGALNVYRHGVDARFHEEEFELARWFADAAALAIDNAEIRAHLELEAQTDSLTGLYNHRFFHERLRAELTRASRTRDSVALLMFDIDDFKRVNDICGHGVGDQILIALSETVRKLVRGSDVVCRLGGEEFAVIMPSCGSGDAVGLARRLMDRLEARPIDAAGEISVSIGVAQGPEHAMNPRELVACAEAAMMAAKARGKSRIVVYDGTTTERPESDPDRDARSIAHLKMLQSLSGRLNRLNDMREIGEAIVSELRMLIDYHSCRLYVIEGDYAVPIAHGGEILSLDDRPIAPPAVRLGEGITGHVAASGRPLLVPNALDCEHTVHIPGTPKVDESLIAVPLRYGARSIGVIFLSKLGVDQFDGDDLRLLEVLGGHAAVALENARLYEAVRREAENAKAWLEFADVLATAGSLEEISEQTVTTVARLMGVEECSLWLEDKAKSEFRCVAQVGYAGESPTRRSVARVPGRAIESHMMPFVMTAEELREAFWDGDPSLELRAAAIAPLHPGYGVRGWVTVRTQDDDVRHFTDDRLRLLEGLTYRTSMALQKAQLFEDQQQSTAIANAMLEFARGLASARDETEVLGRIPELAAKLLGAPAVFWWMQGDEPDVIRVETAWAQDAEVAQAAIGFSFSADTARKLLERGQPFVLTPADLERIGGTTAETVDYAVAPSLLPCGRLAAIVAAGSAPGETFSELRLRMLGGLADQARLAVAATR
jgi:diguanylate cyclase (GGDEF)-like protein